MAWKHAEFIFIMFILYLSLRSLVQRVHTSLSGRKIADDHAACNRDRVVSILISLLYEFRGVTDPIHFDDFRMKMSQLAIAHLSDSDLQSGIL